ncbi:phage head morphogenesis protein [Lactobacillus sp. 3B(2020)]|nr:phage head morphogenesis protein [Lactobacillus sp. 3B(2020)]
MATSQYWTLRKKKEQEWIKQNLANDELFAKRLTAFYNQAIADINTTIQVEINRVGADQVTKMDVQAFQGKAQTIVEEAEQRRKAGDHVTYSDYTKEINQRLKVYNATMRINRLEHLKSEVGLDMLRANLKVDAALRDKLAGDFQKEAIRQAGIMMDSAQHSKWTSPKMAKIIMAQTNGANFSQRLWANQDVLKAKLDQVLATGLISGQGVQVMARRLRDQVKTTVTNQSYVVERLARTESARVQVAVQMDAIKKDGFKYVEWIEELSACPTCKEIGAQDFGKGKGVWPIDKVPLIPVHPNCRCGIVEWVPDDY